MAGTAGGRTPSRMKSNRLTRRAFLHRGVTLAAGSPLAFKLAPGVLFGAEEPAISPANLGNAKVAIVECKSYGKEVQAALDKSLDLLGGIGSLVGGKTVTVKLNLTSTMFVNFLGRSAGETFMTHYATALALANSLAANGARRIRFVESTQSRSTLTESLNLADWDLKPFETLGKVEFLNTRNLGGYKNYSTTKVPGGGRMFSEFNFNQAYEDTDVMVSLAKLKNHVTCGVTLSMKNLFGITPNSLYGDAAGSEDATAGRGPLHNPSGFERIKLPGLKAGIKETDPTWRVPRIVVDVCAARPIHLAIIDGIMSVNGGEGPWCTDAAPMKLTTPGVLIAGLNPVSTDAVSTAVMGYPDPTALRGAKPFQVCDNHLLLAEQAGLGTARLAKIDVRGLSIEKARYPYG